jgi:hypothetical protein
MPMSRVWATGREPFGLIPSLDVEEKVREMIRDAVLVAILNSDRWPVAPNGGRVCDANDTRRRCSVVVQRNLE